MYHFQTTRLVVVLSCLVQCYYEVTLPDPYSAATHFGGVTMGPERQADAAAGAPRVAQDTHVIDEGGQDDPAPAQAPPPPPATARTMPQRMARLEEDVHEIRRTLAE
ncbi:hypothetical protein Tco_1242184 [Tanacetum coccineum]